MNKNHFCAIMAGGYSHHFWPVSRESCPRQFICLPGHTSLVRAAYERCKGVVPQENILVITLSRYKGLVETQIPELSKENLLLEPNGKKTAPCVAYSTFSILRRNPDAVISMLPSDLVINDVGLFRSTLSGALDYASENEALMTLGIAPSHPDPNYGYIQVVGGKVDENDEKPIKVKTFTEKPSEELASEFVRSGEFFWNSGIFAWKASLIYKELCKYAPRIVSCFKGWQAALGTGGESSFIEKAYADCPKLSIDYAVMEKTDKAWLFPVKFGWRDVNNWESFHEHFLNKDPNNNVSYARKTMTGDSTGCILVSNNEQKLIAVKGLENYVVIDYDDVLLICPKDDKQYKDFISELAMPGYERYR